MADDAPDELVCSLMRYFSAQFDILLVSGRPEEHRATTERWLDQNHIYDVRGLFMRRTGDYRPDTEVKREIYQNQIAPRYKVRLVLDDRSSVVAMWRSLGLTCWQVAEGNF